MTEDEIDWEGAFSIGDKGLKTVGSEYMKEKYFKEEKEPPSYKNRIPLGKKKDTGEILWISLENDDRWAVLGRTGSGKTWTLKTILSRAFVGGTKVLHLSDVKNDFANLDHGKGIQKSKMNLLENEVRRPIPVNMYAPRFMKDDYQPKPPQKDNFHFFAYELSDLSESDFMTLIGAGSQSKRDIAMELYDEIDEDTSVQDLIDYIEEEKGNMDEANTLSKRSAKSTLKNLKRQKVISKRGQKAPLDEIENSVVAIAFENWDRYKRDAIEKLEIQISITTRKTLDKIRENELDGKIVMVVDEAHAFVPDKRDSVSADDIVNVVDLGRAYGIPMIFATQKYTDLAQGVRTQCNKFLLSSNITVSERRKVLKEANIWESGDAQRNRFSRIFKNMGRFEWMYIDKSKSTYEIVKPISPLCSD